MSSSAARSWLSGAIFVVVMASVAVLSPAADAQSRVPTVSIGRITSEKSCTLYQESAGRSAVVATPYVVAAASSWRTWLVRDCVSNFATIRTSLEAALASTGKFAVKTQSAAYTVSGAISQVGGDPGPAPAQPTPTDGFSISSRQIFVSMEVTVRDATGRLVYGGLLTKHLETGSNIRTPGLETSSSQTGDAVYTELQDQVALAVARLVAFHIVPLRVVSQDGGEIRLNYGSPLLALGTIVHVTSPDGGAMVRYRVTSADASSALAEPDGEGDAAAITPGSLANVVESDDPAANERRIHRVELP